MSGLDKIKSQILDEAKQNAAAQTEAAEQKAQQIMDDAMAEAKKEAERIAAKSDKDTKAYLERIQSSGDMKKKKAILQAKQDVISTVLEKAYSQVLQLDADAYFELIKKMLQEYAQPQSGVIYFSEKDLKRMPEKFENVITKIAEEKGGVLTLSGETKKMDGGFILVYGGIEENCTIKAIFDAKKDELSDQVHGLIFA